LNSNVTLKQIADELGVSAMTVSRAVNHPDKVDSKTLKRVLETAHRLGYTPNHVAKSLVSSRTYTIGVVIPEISHSFFPEVVRGIEEIAYNTNYQLFLTNSAESSEREQKAVDALRSKRVDGILISCAQTTTADTYYRQLVKTGWPLVFFDRCAENIGASCVSVNDKASSRRITQHLINLGYTRIAHLSGSQKLSIGKKRLEGFIEALQDADLAIRPDWQVESGFQEKGGYEAMKKLLNLPLKDRPRAVVAVNDPAAFGAIDAIRDHGLSIPGDIAIVGFSDDIRAKLIPCPLTTVRQPAYQVGTVAADKLIRTIENSDEQVEYIEVGTEIIIRASCGSTSEMHASKHSYTV
jgi:DNA-binding LacI/PurR family transcriptional regulator